MSIVMVQDNYKALYAALKQAENERDNWRNTAEQAMRNTEYYKGLVEEIGDIIGESARVDDTGMVHDRVLCAKVPELVRRRIA